ncbi:MAG: hypothetical protein K2K25_06880 [Muribaculaceae bacterium]|nr:hypothetical protein [Muribaculaceae bacterium]
MCEANKKEKKQHWMAKNIKRIFSYLLMMVFSFPIWGKEFIHVVTSKGIFETSEDLWFKCVAFDDSTMRVSDRSHTAYVEILDPKDSVVWREKYRMSGGMCDGHAYVGDDWKPGEYRLFVHTRGSLGREDTVVYPKRLLIVRELPEVPEYLNAAKDQMQYIDIPDSARNEGLNVTVILDSTEYHTRSKVKATIRVADADGNPVRAVVVMSVADALYSYPPADVDIESQIYDLLHDTLNAPARGFVPFLSDGASSGHLRSGRKKNTIPLDGQYINVFDEKAEKGDVNIIATGIDGYFEVSPEIGSSLGKTLLLRPLVDEYMKPKLEIDDPFKDIAVIRKSASEINFPSIRRDRLKNEIKDTADYSGRHTVQLDEVLVNGNSKNYSRRKKDKLLSYLDSLAISKGQAWVCCGKIVNGEYVGGFLNDYYPGYTHHPIDNPYYFKTPPKNISIPERGKLYHMVKYKWLDSMQNLFEIEELYAIYAGPYYTDQELFAMEGIVKSEGYYPKHRFQLPDEDDRLIDMEDFRNTLLWLSRAQTDENGEFTVEFPTSDIKSTFRISGLILTPNIKDARTINEYFKVK